MAPSSTKQWILASKPSGAPILSGPDATWKLQTAELPALKEGQVLAKVQYFSNDTGLRHFIGSTVAPERHYVHTVPVGSPMRCGVLAEIIESASPAYKPGDLVVNLLVDPFPSPPSVTAEARKPSRILKVTDIASYTTSHLGAWSEYVVLEAAACQSLAPLPNGLPLTHYLGAFGASGIAAYGGLYFAGEAKPGQTIVISAAAGATGSMAVQIAVQLLKARRVIGIAGSDEKCAWVKDELGAHECINYNSPTFLEELKAATPDEVDVYFDNVGGFVLDAVLTRVNKFGNIAICGAVASYNSQDKPMELRNWFEVISSRITIRGFIMLDYMDKAPQILEELIGAAVDGRIKLDHGETVVEARIEEQPEIWMRLFSGQNQGKLLTKLIVD